MKKQSFLTGSLLLTGSALLAKLFGAAFKIPLTALLGGTGMGYFSCAYGLFLPLYAVLVTGLSTAVARPVADFAGRGNMASARRVLTTARRLAWGMGLTGMLAASFLAAPFLRLTSGSMQAFPAVIAIAPSVLLCCLTAVERGYYEGLCSMTPTAVSQALEAFTKLVCGLVFCRMFMVSPPAWLLPFGTEGAGACGAVLGVMLSTLAGYLCLLLCRRAPVTGTNEPIPSSRHILRMLLSVLIPAALGALVTNLTSLIDLMTMLRQFSALLSEDADAFYQGAALDSRIPREDAAAFVYGSFMGLSVTVFNLVPSLTNMLAKGVLPCTAQAWSIGDRKAAAGYARQVLLLTGLAAIPAGCGLLVLAEGVLRFLYAGQEAEIMAATAGLQWLMPGLVFLCMTFPVFSLLQAMGRADLPVKVMLPGLLVKLIGNLLLIPVMYTAGAALATSLCYGVILMLSLVCLRKVSGEVLHIGKPVAVMTWGGILCAAAAWCGYDRATAFLPQRAALLLAVLVGALVYLIVIWGIRSDLFTAAVPQVRSVSPPCAGKDTGNALHP